MPNSLTLITLEYPPQVGGVARYLSGLVEASRGEIEVVVVAPSVRWWNLVGMCLKQKRKTLLVSHVFPIGTAAWLSRVFFGGPEYLVLFHGTDLRSVRSPLKKILLQLICRSAKATLANSHSTKEDLLQLVPFALPTTILPAVEETVMPTRAEARGTLRLDAAQSVVVSIARLVPRKGIDIALEAIARIQQKQEVKYVVIGNGPDEERLFQIAKDSGAKVEWLAHTDDNLKWTWLAAADVFLLPGRDVNGDVEGFGIVFLEAAQVSIPSVAGRSGGAGEAVVDGKTGILVDSQDTQDVVRAVEKLLDLSELRQEMGSAAKQRVDSEFHWADRWKQLKGLLT